VSVKHKKNINNKLAPYGLTVDSSQSTFVQSSKSRDTACVLISMGSIPVYHDTLQQLGLKNRSQILAGKIQIKMCPVSTSWDEDEWRQVFVQRV